MEHVTSFPGKQKKNKQEKKNIRKISLVGANFLSILPKGYSTLADAWLTKRRQPEQWNVNIQELPSYLQVIMQQFVRSNALDTVKQPYP